MSRRAISLLITMALGLAAQAAGLGSEAEREQGRQLYERLCSQCHGMDGDGRGVAARRLRPRPRDFTAGKYKIRSTPSGRLPTDEDLKAVIREGMPYTSMPAWPRLTDAQLQNLVYHLKTFADDFAGSDDPPQGMTIPQAPVKTETTVEAGRGIYEQLGCARCHGELGRGDGTSAPTLTDDWGHHIRPADLTAKWTFRGGASREDLFRTFSTGLNGTPMPSYRDALSDEERWQLVDYVESLSAGDGPDYATLMVARPVAGALDLSRGTELFEGVEAARFPVVGQIMQPGRSFHPMVRDVRVRAVYGGGEIAFLVQWDDMAAERTGSNDPTLEVPPFDEDAAERSAGEETGEEGGFWGEEAVEEEPSADEFWGDEAVEEQDAGDDFWGEGAEGVEAAASYSDAVAIQLPTGAPAGVAKPYFLLGDAERPVDLWFLDLGSSGPRRYAARGSNAMAPIEDTELETVAEYDRGQWSAIFKREMRSRDAMSFEQGTFVPIAFSVWDGFSEDRGNRRGLTPWMYVYIAPRQQPSAVGPMIRGAAGVLAVELALILWLRWSRRRRRESGSENTAYA